MKGRTKETEYQYEKRAGGDLMACQKTDVIRSVHRLCRADKKKAKAKHGVYQ